MIKAAVNTLATWAWGNSSDGGDNNVVSAEFCLENFSPIPPLPCIIAVSMKVLGMLIIIGACLNKAPVILNISKNRSVAGIALSAVYSETIMYGNAAFYSVLKKNPFTAYGESLILTFQSMAICVLCWIYAKPKVGLFQRLLAILGFCIYLFVVFFALTEDYYYMILSVNLPVLIFSRGSQIYTFHSCKHTGSQSLITTGMNFIGSAIRVLTTISEIGFDIPMLSGYFISLGLNAILIAQFLMYRKKTEEYLKSIQAKSD
jgi:mannose-P-dolichol utilization defect protein 1